MTKNGLYLFGTIIGRYKDVKTNENGKFETVKYTVNCNGNVFRVSEKNPTAYHEIGEVIELPVRAGIYEGHMYFTIRKEESTGGTNF